MSPFARTAFAVLLLGILTGSAIAADSDSGWRIPYDRGLSRELSVLREVIATDPAAARKRLAAFDESVDLKLVRVSRGHFRLAGPVIRRLSGLEPPAESKNVEGAAVRDSPLAPFERARLTRQAYSPSASKSNAASRSLAQDAWGRGRPSEAIRWYSTGIHQADGDGSKPSDRRMIAAYVRYIAALHLAGFPALASAERARIGSEFDEEYVEVGGVTGAVSDVMSRILSMPVRKSIQLKRDSLPVLLGPSEQLIEMNQLAQGQRLAIAAADEFLTAADGSSIWKFVPREIGPGLTKLPLYPPAIGTLRRSKTEVENQGSEPNAIQASMIAIDGNRLFCCVGVSAEQDPSVDPFLDSESNAEQLVCLDLDREGDLRWRKILTPADGRIAGGAVSADMLVIVLRGGRDELTAVGLSTSTGQERWRLSLGMPAPNGRAPALGAVQVIDRAGLLFVLADPSTIICVEPSIGRILWAQLLSPDVSLVPLSSSECGHPLDVTFVDRTSHRITSFAIADGNPTVDPILEPVGDGLRARPELMPIGRGIAIGDHFLWPCRTGVATVSPGNSVELRRFTMPTDGPLDLQRFGSKLLGVSPTSVRPVAELKLRRSR
ncbi:hypothetical protein Pan189_15830 [Stratiformator vulcanicus]|uniref:Pyrrolo-quinoline quinone repeat domain-containing protein n=1 Tax=Stratiformator vulcanicus TaxID=2527980 RepID=A0A517QZZ8_9PLAN|nr:hypothetical protein Pan189_15830 [Stratiformator vulcanicus]